MKKKNHFLCSSTQLKSKLRICARWHYMKLYFLQSWYISNNTSKPNKIIVYRTLKYKFLLFFIFSIPLQFCVCFFYSVQSWTQFEVIYSECVFSPPVVLLLWFSALFQFCRSRRPSICIFIYISLGYIHQIIICLAEVVDSKTKTNWKK